MKALLFIILLFNFSNLSIAQMYKCTQSDGKVTFTDKGCNTNKKEVIQGGTYSFQKAKIFGFRSMKGVSHIPVDTSDAATLFKDKANQGDPGALYNFGITQVYANHIGDAISWFYKAGIQYVKLKDLSGASAALFAIHKADSGSWFAQDLERKISNLRIK